MHKKGDSKDADYFYTVNALNVFKPWTCMFMDYLDSNIIYLHRASRIDFNPEVWKDEA